MDTHYDILIEKIKAINSPLELHNELYPKHLGKAVEMQSPELRLMEGKLFGDIPMNLELRLSVEDSPNSAGVVIEN